MRRIKNQRHLRHFRVSAPQDPGDLEAHPGKLTPCDDDEPPGLRLDEVEPSLDTLKAGIDAVDPTGKNGILAQEVGNLPSKQPHSLFDIRNIDSHILNPGAYRAQVFEDNVCRLVGHQGRAR